MPGTAGARRGSRHTPARCAAARRCSQYCCSESCPTVCVQVAPQVGDDSVVVEQGVVDIEQEDHGVFHAAQITSHELLPFRPGAHAESARGMWPWSRARAPARTGCDTVILNEDDSAWVGSADSWRRCPQRAMSCASRRNFDLSRCCLFGALLLFPTGAAAQVSRRTSTATACAIRCTGGRTRGLERPALEHAATAATATPAAVVRFTTADIDADGDRDIVATTAGPGLDIFLNLGRGRFRAIHAARGSAVARPARDRRRHRAARIRQRRPMPRRAPPRSTGGSAGTISRRSNKARRHDLPSSAGVARHRPARASVSPLLTLTS